MTKDMTKGSPMKLLLSFTIPLFLGGLFQQFYYMVDTIVIGRFVGIEALAAVGTIGGFNFMVIGFSQGLAMGFSALMAQCFGAKDLQRMRKIYAMSIIMSMLVITVISSVFSCLSIYLLRLINTPENIISMSNDYIVIIYSFLIFPVFYNLFSATLRAVGDTKTPVVFLLLASVLNIAFDLASVIILKLGVKGVALSTVLSQGISAALCFAYIHKKLPFLAIRKKDMTIDKAVCIKLLKIGIPSALQYSVTALGVIIVQSALNGFGSNSIAAYSLGNKIENIISQYLTSLGMGVSTFASQNYGMRGFKRIKNGFNSGICICICYAILGLIATFYLAEPISSMFVHKTIATEEVIQKAVLYARTQSLFLIPLGFIFIFRTGCQGLGSGSGSIPLLSALSELLVRIATAFTLPRILGYQGICLTSVTAWVITGFMLPFVYFNYIKKLENASTS